MLPLIVLVIVLVIVNKSKSISSLNFDNRSPIRKVQVLEIINDTEIKIIKGWVEQDILSYSYH